MGSPPTAFIITDRMAESQAGGLKMDIAVKVTYKNSKLQALRLAAGLSQSQLADKTGINVRTLQHYEQGDKDLNAARITTLLNLCNTLECTLQEILTEPEALKLLSEYKEK